MIVSEAEAAFQFCVRTEIKLIALGTEAANLGETNTAFLLVDIGGTNIVIISISILDNDISPVLKYILAKILFYQLAI